MHILFLSQVLPYPLDAGPKMRSYFVLRHLTQKHKVTLLTFIRDTDRVEDMDHLAEFCHAVHTVPMRRPPLRDLRFLFQSLLTRQPFLIIRDEVPDMVAKIHQLLNQEKPFGYAHLHGRFDVVHADQLWMAQYALAAQACLERSRKDAAVTTVTAANPRLILDQHNAVHLIPRRLVGGEKNPLKRAILAREARLLMSYEADTCNHFDRVVWVTEEDRQAVAALSPSTANAQTGSSVIPICADPAHTHSIPRDFGKQRITFLGGLHWPPNAQGIVWFAREVFPQVRAAIPEAILTVIGKSPPTGLDGESVEVTGYVADLAPYLAQTAAFIVPLHAGGGMRVKILDAWSWGLPIVSTTIGAEGIEIQRGKDILIADTAPDFAGAVIRVLSDRTLAHQLGDKGRQTVLEKYNWQTIYSAWDEVYEGMA